MHLDRHVAQRRDLADALVATGIPHLGKAKEHGRFRDELTAVMARVGNVRRLGAAALDLAYVAAGRFDGYWERELSAWDIAAGILLVKEAGGLVEGLREGTDPLDGALIAANDGIFKAMADTIRA